MAIWMITNHPKGIASVTLAKDLKITQKIGLVRAASPSSCRPHSIHSMRRSKGDCEADTTFVGGKEKNKHAHKRTPGSQGGANKAVVIGALEREGELRTAHIEDTKAKTVHGFVKANVAKGAALMTDEDRSFLGLEGEYNVSQREPQLRASTFGSYCIHTNGIKSVWALLKRQIYGIHHWVSDVS